MARVKRGTKRRARRKKYLKRTKGFFLTKSKLYQSAQEAANRADRPGRQRNEPEGCRDQCAARDHHGRREQPGDAGVAIARVQHAQDFGRRDPL